MDVITTHINADFDALGSMLAARRLYPEAKMVIPGGQEKSLRDFFVRSTILELPVIRPRDVPLDQVTRLILVDCRQRGRIGTLGEIADREGVRVVIYDHHPPSEDDIHGDEEHIEPTGSTLAILCRELAAREVRLDPHEATIMAMGIYEDTGSLTFTSTTREDYLAAAYLVSQGCDLSLVAELMNRMLTTQQILLLGDLIRGCRRHRIHGVEVVTTQAGVGEYVDELAFLVHRLMDMENLKNVFALFFGEDRITLIARSRTREVDAAAVARVFGGGGHATAASATIRDQTPAQATEMLLSALHATVSPARTAQQIMTYPVKTVETSQTVGEARELMTRFNVNTLVATEEGRVRGLLSRQTVDRAIRHGLANDGIDGYMQTHFRAVEPGAPFTDVYAIMVSGQQPLVPVVQGETPVGVVTRADFLRQLRAEQAEDDGKPQPELLSAPRTTMRKDVMRLIKSRLPPLALERLKDLGRVAQRLGFSAYLVGGIVRDLLLDIPNLDVDVVVEGDAIAVARAFAEGQSVRCTGHERFGTAALRFPDGFKIDLATARTEYYDQPAALPIVEASSLKLDLFRRDFTINTLVVAINPDGFGRLVDFFGAYRDLKEGIVRVLHNLSFIEDPTRILRAVRFEQRFRFSISRPTLRLLEKAVALEVLARLSGPRLAQELRHILEEENPLPALERLAELGILSQIHPALRLEPRDGQVLHNVADVLSWWKLTGLSYPLASWRVWLYGLIAGFRDKEIRALGERLSVSERLLGQILLDKAGAERAIGRMARRSRFPASVIHRLLAGLSNEALLYAMARTYRTSTRRAIATYLTQLVGVRTRLSGKDLAAMGVAPGPVYGQVLRRVLEAKLDGKAPTREQELALARQILRRMGHVVAEPVRSR